MCQKNTVNDNKMTYLIQVMLTLTLMLVAMLMPPSRAEQNEILRTNYGYTIQATGGNIQLTSNQAKMVFHYNIKVRDTTEIDTMPDGTRHRVDRMLFRIFDTILDAIGHQVPCNSTVGVLLGDINIHRRVVVDLQTEIDDQRQQQAAAGVAPPQSQSTLSLSSPCGETDEDSATDVKDI